MVPALWFFTRGDGGPCNIHIYIARNNPEPRDGRRIQVVREHEFRTRIPSSFARASVYPRTRYMIIKKKRLFLQAEYIHIRLYVDINIREAILSLEVYASLGFRNFSGKSCKIYARHFPSRSILPFRSNSSAHRGSESNARYHSPSRQKGLPGRKKAVAISSRGNSDA